MTFPDFLAKIDLAKKIIPILEAVFKELAPLAETEGADVKAAWAAILKAFEDLKAGLKTLEEAVKAAKNG